MLNRDFTQSNKEYIKKNRVPLCIFTAFLIIGIVVMSIFGLRGNFEMAGYNEFTVTVGADSSKYESYIEQIESVMNNADTDYDSISVFGEGDETKLVVRYLNELDKNECLELNHDLSVELELDMARISDHVNVGPSVDSLDYIFTSVAILFLFVVASIFSYVRYNGASAVALLLACVLGTISFLSLTAILRLSVGVSYLAMLVILNVLIMYLSIQLFESMREDSYLDANDYSNAISNGINKTKFRACVISSAILTIGVLFVLFAPSAIKYVSLNILFMAVVLLATVMYILPFAWNMFITSSRKKVKKVSKKEDDINDAEPQDTTENATIEG